MGRSSRGKPIVIEEEFWEGFTVGGCDQQLQTFFEVRESLDQKQFCVSSQLCEGGEGSSSDQ